MSIACWLEYFCEGQIISYFILGKIFTVLFLHFLVLFFIKVYTCSVQNKYKILSRHKDATRTVSTLLMEYSLLSKVKKNTLNW